MAEVDNHAEAARHSAWPAATRWSLVVRARGPDSLEASRALDELCRIYWKPLYVFARHRGHGHEDAQDVTQGFIVSLLKDQEFDRAQPGNGSFRAFLLARMKNFLANDWDRRNADKRGGGRLHIPLDPFPAEGDFGPSVSDPALSPDEAYDHSFAHTLLDQVLVKLQAEYVDAGKGRIFDALKICLTDIDDAAPYAELGARLGMTERNVNITVHRMRERYEKLIRSDVAETLTDPRQAKEELRSLLAALRRLKR